MPPFRKLFLDSRHRVSGTHGDFTIELPQMLDTTRTSSVYLASCSVSNDFDTIIQGVNSNLYFLSQDSTHAPNITITQKNLYLLYTKDRNITVSASNSTLYMFLATTAGVGSPYVLYTYTIAPGTYTVEAFAPVLQAVLSSGSTVTWNEAIKAYNIAYGHTSNTSWWMPSPADIDSAVTALNANTAAATYTPGDHTQSINGLLRAPSEGTTTPQNMFSLTATTGVPIYTTPVVSTVFPLILTTNPQFSDIAAALQLSLRIVLPNATVTTSNRQFVFNSGSATAGIQLPLDSELRSASWQAANWTGTSYDITNPASYNAVLQLPGPSSLTQVITTGTLPPYIQSYISSLSPAYYDSGTPLAAAIQAALRAVDATATVTFDTTSGKMSITSTVSLRFPTEEELRSPSWQAINWTPYSGASYNIQDPASLNDRLYFPGPTTFATSVTTGALDMLPYRSLYLASSIANYSTMQSGTGALDLLARIPVDQPFGSVIVFRHLGPSDALAASDLHFRTISFQFRDYRGRPIGVDQPVQLELVFLDSDPYTM